MPSETAPKHHKRWPGFRHVVFDCDSTLSGIEGVDELAQTPGLRAEIEELTAQAMAGTIDLDLVYERRLALLKPSKEQVAALRAQYKNAAVTDAQAVIDGLHHLRHDVYVVSGGLAEPVREYSVYLGIPEERVVAVEASHETLSGDWWRLDPSISQDYLGFEAGDLTRSDGKTEAIRELTGDGDGGVLLVGDGESDLRAAVAADLFVGFGGFVRRERVAEAADVFINEASLAPVMALAAGPIVGEPSGVDPDLARQAVDMYRRGAVEFNNDNLEARFVAAFDLAEAS